jgi:hypothetical protein
MKTQFTAAASRQSAALLKNESTGFQPKAVTPVSPNIKP